jgi:hypothetical protein
MADEPKPFTASEIRAAASYLRACDKANEPEKARVLAELGREFEEALLRRGITPRMVRESMRRGGKG